VSKQLGISRVVLSSVELLRVTLDSEVHMILILTLSQDTVMEEYEFEVSDGTLVG
jgi:hypothetical protein